MNSQVRPILDAMRQGDVDAVFRRYERIPIRNYRRSLELNPGNTNAKRVLDSLNR